MYLYSKLAGIVTNKMKIPAELADFTMKIVHFVLQSPCLESDRAEFEIGKEKIMETTNFETQTETSNVNEETEQEQALNHDEEMEMLKKIALMATMVKVQQLEQRVKALEHKTCCCQACKTRTETQDEVQAA